MSSSKSPATIRHLIVKNYVLIGLIDLYFLLRLPPLVFKIIPFTFDHGKDSLAVMDLVVNLSPKLIGPWTSIPGLYFGPAWYYLLAPAYFIFNFNPLAGPITMMILGLIQLLLVYKYFGKVAALLVTAAPLWIMTTTSAWNPYPITLITWLILIALLKLQKNHKDKKMWLLLGMSIGFGFHFSTAFAVLYPALTTMGLWLRKIKVTLPVLLIAALGLAIPFLPQAVFEIRYDFPELKAAVAYLRGEVDIETAPKLQPTSVAFSVLHETKTAVLGPAADASPVKEILLFAFVTFIISGLILARRHPNTKIAQKSLELSIWLIISIGWFYLMHYNSWYVLGLAPLAVILVAELTNYWPKKLTVVFVVCTIIAALLPLTRLNQDRIKYSNDRAFLPVKQKTIQTIYELADGKPFASYQYAPHIYDFDWQFLYFVEAQHGQKLPTDFSYEPNVVPYIVQKPDLIAYFSDQIDTRPAEIFFYIVEKPLVQDFLDDWWQKQSFANIDQTIHVSDQVTIFVATPN